MRVDATAKLPPAPGLVRRALLSVFDKAGLIELAKGLAAHEVEILASGGTANAIEEAGVKVTRIEKFTGAKEVLDGRVKTLHPKIHAGILADRRLPEHEKDLKNNAYPPIDLVVCNLYPFEKALARNAPRHEMVENIDIGGPTLVRAAAKNEAGGVTVLVDPADYSRVADLVSRAGLVPSDVRRELAAKAFQVIAKYDLDQQTIGRYDLGPNAMFGEPTFVPASDTAGEDEGYVMMYVHDRAANSSAFVILDGSDTSAPPIATVPLPQRVPAGFHGSWIPF